MTTKPKTPKPVKAGGGWCRPQSVRYLDLGAHHPNRPHSEEKEMKPELKAFWKAVLDTPIGDPGGIHWRGDELWLGPIPFGAVIKLRGVDGRWIYDTGLLVKNEPNPEFVTESQARTALMSAAQEQIRNWFREKSE